MKRANIHIHNQLTGILTEDENRLIPEGWLLGIAERSWKISQRDRMSFVISYLINL